MSILTYAALLGAAATSVSAHGALQWMGVDGVVTEGFNMNSYYDAQGNAARTKPSYGWWQESTDRGFVQQDGKTSIAAYTPTKDHMICGAKAVPGALHLDVKAGSTIDFIWQPGWPQSHHGPVLAYLAKCPGTSCAGVDKTTLKFFKIAEGGLLTPGNENGWASDALIANNGTASATLPAGLPNGAYVARHEIIALHGAGSAQGAQFYPNCVNLMVSGGTGTLSTDGVAGSALYNENDPGILMNIYARLTGYTIPGPPLVGSGGSGGSPAPAPSSSAAPPASSAAPPASSAAPPASSAAPAPAPTTSAAPAPSGPVVTATSIATTIIPVTTTAGGASPAPTGGSGSGGSTKPLPEGVTLADLLAWLKIILNRTSPAKRSEFFSHMLM